MAILPRSAFDPRMPFTRAEGLAAGITPWQLRGPAYVRVLRNVYLSREVPRTLAVRCRAALARRAEKCRHQPPLGRSPVGGSVPAPSTVHLTIGYRSSFAAAGIQTHRTMRTRATHTRQGIPVPSPEQTFLDLAVELDLVTLVVLGDRLVKRGVVSRSRRVESSAAWDGYHAARARRAADLVRDGVDSPPETRLRMLIVLAGLPEPAVNHIIRCGDTGEWERRFELAYEKVKVAVEYEGRHHRGDDVWASDIDRREELDRRTWRIVQVINPGLYENPLRTLQRIEQARRDRGAPPTRVFSDEWRRYFPGRDAA